MRGIMELGRSAYLRSEKLPHTMQHAIHGQQNEHPKSATKMGKNPPTVVQICPFLSWEMPTNLNTYKIRAQWHILNVKEKLKRISTWFSPPKIGDISSDMTIYLHAIVDLVMQPRKETWNLNMTPLEEEVWLWRSSRLTKLAQPCE